MNEDAYNAWLESLLEVIDLQEDYETQHQDAGDNYAHMVREGWSSTDEARLNAWLLTWIQLLPPVEDLDLDDLIEAMLSYFEPRPGHIFGRGSDQNKFVLASYPVGEIEIEIPDRLDSETSKFAQRALDEREICGKIFGDDLYIYRHTDAVWNMVITTQDMVGLIEASVQLSAQLRRIEEDHATTP